MKYRIVTNGDKFRVQTWVWWFPFWSYVQHYNMGLALTIKEWSAKEDAEEYIKTCKAADAYAARPWIEVVE